MSRQNLQGHKSPRLVCIADPTSLRWQAFEKEVGQFNDLAGKKIQLDLIDWRALIQADGDLLRVDGFDAADYSNQPALVRIESPARDFEVTRALLAAGARQTGLSSDARWSETEFEKGKLVEPRLIFIGLKRVLTGLSKSAAEIEGLELLSQPQDIVSMFDKNHTSRRLLAAGISTPDIDEYLPWEPDTASVDISPTQLANATQHIIDELKQLKRKSVYVKLNSGSSSSGILFLELNGYDFNAISTMALIDGDFHNTRLLQKLDARGIGLRLNYLFRQGVTVQEGIRKSQIGGDNFDVRVVVIGGKIEATVFRVSQNPFTNLHLGGYRGNWQDCRKLIPNRIWLDAMDECVRAAELYQTHIVGVDLAFDRNYFNHYIIELNPFGDFFPGWKNENGETIYQLELKSLFGE